MTTTHAGPRFGCRAWIAIITCLIVILCGSLVLTTSPASAETPAERCARETKAYNNTWAQGWAQSNNRPASEAPPPPVPYVCQNPDTTTPPPEQPSVTAPSIENTPDASDRAGPQVHAPTDIPSPGRPILQGEQEVETFATTPRNTPSRPSPTRVSVDNYDYPVNHIHGQFTDKCGNNVVLRTGYFDGKKGFGQDKAEHKHGLKSTNDIVELIANNECGEAESATTRTYLPTYCVAEGLYEHQRHKATMRAGRATRDPIHGPRLTAGGRRKR